MFKKKSSYLDYGISKFTFSLKLFEVKTDQNLRISFGKHGREAIRHAIIRGLKNG